jgi:hypothetical protein
MGEDDTLRGAVSRGLALPSPLDYEQLALNTTPGQKIALSDPSLSTSATLEYRLSWDHQFRDWDALGRISVFTKQSMNSVALLPLQLLALYSPSCAPPNIYTMQLCNALSSQTSLSGIFDGAQLQIDHKSRDGLVWGFNYSIERLHPHATVIAAEIVPDLRNDETWHKVNANLGYGWSQWTADVRLFYSSAVQSLVLQTSDPVGAVLSPGKDIVSLSPHISWTPLDDITLDLAADNLWGYKEDLMQRTKTTYFLTLKLAY